MLGSEAVAKSAPGGYTMIVGNAGSHGVNAGIYPKLPYDVVRDFVPLAMICTAPNVMVVTPLGTLASCGNFSRLGETQGEPLGKPRSRC